MQPDFTDEEQYLISFWKSGREQTVSSQVSAEATNLAGPLIMVGLGYYFESYLLALSALFVYGMLKIREVVQQTRWGPVLASIIRKYEEKIVELDTKSHSAQTTASPDPS